MSQNLKNVVKFQKFQRDNLVDFENCCKTHIYTPPLGGQKTQAYCLAPQRNLLSVVLGSHFQSRCGVPRCDDGMMWWCDVVMMWWCDDEIIGWWRPFLGNFWAIFHGLGTHGGVQRLIDWGFFEDAKISENFCASSKTTQKRKMRFLIGKSTIS